MATPNRRRPSATPRATRSWVWTAVMASVASMVLVFAALMVLELTQVASTSAPMVVVANADGPTQSSRVTLTPDQLTRDAEPTVTVRLRNDSTSPVRVNVTLTGAAAGESGTLTAALTAAGAVVRSGPLDGLSLEPFYLDAMSTTPLTLELDGTVADVEKNWPADGQLQVVVGAQR